MKYKVTTRGWIVFSLLGVLLIYGIISIGSSLMGNSEEISDVLDETVVNDTEDVTIPESEDSDTDASEVDVDDEEPTGDDSQENDEATNPSDDSSNEGAESDQVSEPSEEIDMAKELEIIFDKNVHLLKPEYHEVLNEWADLLKRHEDLLLIVEGHINGYPYYTDGTYGLNIAENRAEIIKSYMIEQGVAADRIETINKGSSDQAVKTDDQSEHYKNRRAVLYLDKK